MDLLAVLVIASLLHWLPEEPADTVRNVTANRSDDVLISRSHSRVGPTHHAHHRPVRDLQEQEHGGGGMAGVVQAFFPQIFSPGRK